MTSAALAPQGRLLRYPADARTLLLLLALNVLLVVQWLHIGNAWYLLALTYVLAVVALVAKHNHNHCATFRKDWHNSAFELWLSVLTGNTTSGILTAHNRLHHGHNNSEEDFVRCSLVRRRHNWQNLLAFFFVSVAEMYRHCPDDLKEWRNKRPRLYRQAIAERIATLGCILALAIVDWKATLMYCAGPWLFAQWVLVTINLLQHQDCDFQSEFGHSRNITGTAINWMLLNNGFHTAHHNYPALHWSLLPQAHREMAASIRSDLNYRSLWVCAWRRFITGEDWSGNSG
jgi:fatty acid desaturase